MINKPGLSENAGPAIEVCHAGFVYQDRNSEFTALRDIDLTVEKGQFICIAGQSGCGKSTLLSLLAGLRMPSAGTVKIGGRQVTGPDTDRAMVFQSYSLFPWMSAQQNVAFGILHSRRGLDKEAARRSAREFLTRVGMSGQGDKYPYQLSGGMRQRVAIARAFAMDPDIFLLDEPFGAIDTRMRAQLQILTEVLWENSGGDRKTVIFVTHDTEEALLLADRILFMRTGCIACDMALDIPRPRRQYVDDPRFKAAREKLLKLFYEEDCGENRQ